MNGFHNYEGVLSSSEYKIFVRMVNFYYIGRRKFFGELGFDDLLQECVVYYLLEKRKGHWKDAELSGVPYVAWLKIVCRQCLDRILRKRSSWDRGEVAINGRCSAKFDDDGFADSGDMEVIGFLSSRLIFSDSERRIIFEDAFRKVWSNSKLNKRRVFTEFVNSDSSNVEIGRRVGLTGRRVGQLRREIHDELEIDYSDCV